MTNKAPQWVIDAKQQEAQANELRQVLIDELASFVAQRKALETCIAMHKQQLLFLTDKGRKYVSSDGTAVVTKCGGKKNTSWPSKASEATYKAECELLKAALGAKLGVGDDYIQVD